jgi:hypothetical protein
LEIGGSLYFGGEYIISVSMKKTSKIKLPALYDGFMVQIFYVESEGMIPRFLDKITSIFKKQ